MKSVIFKKTNFFLFLFILAFSLNSCITYKEVKVVKIVDSGIKTFSTKGIEIEVAMQIKNPNNYKISIVNSDLDLLVKGNRIGTAKIDNKITLPKKSNKIHRFIIKASMKDMASGALPILMSVIAGSPIDLQIKGDIKAKAKGLSKKFPVDFKERVKL